MEDPQDLGSSGGTQDETIEPPQDHEEVSDRLSSVWFMELNGSANCSYIILHINSFLIISSSKTNWWDFSQIYEIPGSFVHYLFKVHYDIFINCIERFYNVILNIVKTNNAIFEVM